MRNEFRKEALEDELRRLNEQKKLMNDLAGLYATQLNYVHDANKSIEHQMKIKQKIQELDRLGIANIKTEADLDRERTKLEDRQLVNYREMQSLLADIQESEKRHLKEVQEKELQNMKEKIKKAQEYKKEQNEIEKLEQKAEKRREQIAKQKRNQNASPETLNKRFNDDKKLNDILNQIKRQEGKNNTNEYLKDTLKSIKIGNGNVQKYIDMNEKGVSTGAQLLGVAVDTFNKAVEVFASSVKKGFQNQTNAYESTFTNIAARTGMSASTYRNSQMALGGLGKNILHERGLMNNIATSEVQNMWNSLANTGMNQTDILANALDNVITNKVVPYLDTTTQEFNLLNNRVDGDFVKNIRGINKANLEIAGANYVTKDLLDQMITLVQPMSDKAIEDLAQSSTEVTAMANSLIKDYGWDEARAKEYAMMAFKYQKYGAQMMQNGTPAEITDMVSIFNSGYNMYDLKDANNVAGVVLDNRSNFARMGLGHGSTTNGFITNTLYSAMGIGYEEGLNLEKTANQIGLGSKLAKKTDIGNRVGSWANSATQDLADDKLQTTKQLTDILAENLTNEVSAFAEMLGPWFDVIMVALKGIAGILGAKLIGGIGKNLLGIGGNSGTGLLGKFGASAIGQGLANGFLPNAGNVVGAGKIGAFSGTAGSIAGAAGVVAGAAMGVDGGMKAYENFKKGDKVGGALRTTEAVAGVGGAAALLALGASNPIGWIALGVGAIAMFAAKSHEYNESLKDNVENNRAMAKDIKAKWDENNKAIQKEFEEREDKLLELKTELENGKDLEAVRQELIESGILSEKDIEKARQDNRDGLIKLTDTYLTETGRLSGVAEEVNDIFSNWEQDNVGGVRNEIARFVEDHKGNEKGNAHYDEMYAILKTGVDQTYEKQRNGGTLTDAEKELIKGWEWANEDNDVSRSDIKAIYSGFTKVTGKQMGEMLTVESLNKLSKQGFANNYGEHMTNYRNNRLDEDAVANIQAATKADVDKETAIEYLKASGYFPTSKEPYGSAIKKVMDSKGIKYEEAQGYFRQGTDSIPYDNYPAMLHQGEAVLTASTANELRSLIAEYRETKADSIKITQAIEHQTEALVERLDMIYSKIGGNPDDMNIGQTEAETSQIAYNVRRMKSIFSA